MQTPHHLGGSWGRFGSAGKAFGIRGRVWRVGARRNMIRQRRFGITDEITVVENGSDTIERRSRSHGDSNTLRDV